MRLAVIGSGPGGYVAAIRAAQLGAEVLLIEKEEVGGTCLNWGCIPTKTIKASVDAFLEAQRLADFGIDINGSPSADMGRIIARKDSIVATQVKGIRALLKQNGITLRHGSASLISGKSIRLTIPDGSIETLDADSIIIATGSRPSELHGLPFDNKVIISSNDAVNLNQLPASIAIVGAGAIGSEFACIFSGLGAKVTVIEMQDRAVPAEDREISSLLEKEFKKRKIKLYTGVTLSSTRVAGSKVNVSLSDGSQLDADMLLISVGRQLNSDKLGLDRAGVLIGPRGEIIVNERMETAVPGIYAIGDVTGNRMLAHVASKQGLIAAANACGKNEHMDYSVIPAVTFTMPEIGSVGMREQDAERAGKQISIGRFQFRSLAKAHAIGEIAGIIKIISEDGSGKVLGAHIIGPHASELVHEAAIAIKTGLTARQVAEMIHAHPTLSEGLMEAMEDVDGRAIHIAR